MRRASAPVKAPFSWPNSSDSSRFSGIAAQLTVMNGFLARLRVRVNEARQHFLAGAAFAGDQHRGIGGRDLLRELDDLRHRIVAIDHLAQVGGDGGEHRRDHLGVGRQRDVFLGAGADGGHGRVGVIGDAAGDDRNVDVLGFEPRDEVADVER